MEKTRECVSVLIYSPDWTHATAIQFLFSDECNNVFFILKDGFVDTELPGDTHSAPTVFILDLAPGRSVEFIFDLRKKYPDALIICMQHCFLYSDRMVAEYFGGIWLKEYDALMASYPEIKGMDHITSSLFAGAWAPPRIFCEGMTVQVVLASLEQWLHRRLPGVMSSPRVREVSLEWLVRGVSLRETALSLGLSEKVVYHYRWLMMQALGIHHHSRDFIPSLTVTAGPVRWGGSMEIWQT